jgi:hypothetical protein
LTIIYRSQSVIDPKVDRKYPRKHEWLVETSCHNYGIGYVCCDNRSSQRLYLRIIAQSLVFYRDVFHLRSPSNSLLISPSYIIHVPNLLHNKKKLFTKIVSRFGATSILLENTDSTKLSSILDGKLYTLGREIYNLLSSYHLTLVAHLLQLLFRICACSLVPINPYTVADLMINISCCLY